MRVTSSFFRLTLILTTLTGLQTDHLSSKMIHDVYEAWMKENDADQIAIMNNNAPPMPQARYKKAI